MRGSGGREKRKAHTQCGGDRLYGVVATLVEVGDQEVEDGRILLGEIDGLCL